MSRLSRLKDLDGMSMMTAGASFDRNDLKIWSDLRFYEFDPTTATFRLTPAGKKQAELEASDA